jgi:hypothetical protein
MKLEDEYSLTLCVSYNENHKRNWNGMPEARILIRDL